ncbi:hypothetical protein [Myxococcus sp. RHSTA-1-4]|uniref:hypothetical protein n=1 Tax=Myxococcus sp. RHSTA-1-4 TaxID=2874601 RepID=UPI001CBFF6B0|nr:hypothetical protein [Myxococcus sp. RHSTA-1-4]MBZ4418616.1 hypothetical protein [Myxococcus sp. RHSTA-1-4]
MPASHDTFEQALQFAVQRGRTAWPGLALPPEEFRRYLSAKLPHERLARSSDAGLPVEDLYLVCACLHGVKGALEELERVLERAALEARRVDGSQGFVDEVRQLLRIRLLVPEGSRPPRLNEYSGRGPLLRWLRAMAGGVALNAARQTRMNVPLDDLPLSAILGGGAPELEWLKERYLSEFQAAFHEALATLDARERNLLRLSFGQGLGIDALGTMYQVHRSTAARWLVQVRERLLEQTRAALSSRLQLDRTQLDSVMRAIQSRLVASVESLLDSK